MQQVCEHPLDAYCYRKKKSDDPLVSFYTNNAGIPGPLGKMTKPYSTVVPRTTYNSFRDRFIQNEYLAYADDAFRHMRGAPILPGEEIQQWNYDNLPNDYFTRKVVKKENCSCGAKLDDKRFSKNL